MTPLDQLLQDKPLTFMRRHAVSPPDGAGTSFVPDPTRRNADGKVMNKMVTNQKLTSPQTIWNDKDGLFSDTTSSGVDYRTVKGGKVMYANVIDVPRTSLVPRPSISLPSTLRLGCQSTSCRGTADRW